MRLSCEVDVVNRLGASLGNRARKSTWCQLAIGKKPSSSSTPDNTLYLMLSSKQDRNGTKYQLQGNIEQVFVRFVGQGKATIRFSDPTHDLCLNKADPLQLKSFLSAARLASQGGDVSKVNLTVLAPVSANQVDRPKTKLVITTRKEYPITTNFPPSLKHLQVSHCNLKRVDGRILTLRHLSCLNLSTNRLTSLPDDWEGIWNLTELILSSNLIEDLPNTMCSGVLSKTLRLLDLSDNKLTRLKPAFCSLTRLVTLKLDGNELAVLPSRLGTFNELRTLSASRNRLHTLPASFPALQLDTLDISENELLEDGPGSARVHLESIPTLLELAARSICKHKIPRQNAELPSMLLKYLNTAKFCLCGQPCFDSYVHFLSRLDLSRVSRSVTAVDSSGRMHAPAEAFLCSYKCLEKYKKNPAATAWK